MTDSQKIFLVATMDTKGIELKWIADRLLELGLPAVTVDVGTSTDPVVRPDIDRQTVLQFSDSEEARRGILSKERGVAIATMSASLRAFIQSKTATGEVAGVLGIGGSGGSALISPALQSLPIGIPKVLLSTMASGNVAPYIGSSDVTLIYSVVDIAGLNRVSCVVLDEAAHALAGMVRFRRSNDRENRSLGMTMFGVTTPCVTQVRQQLESQGWECLVFHATGSGGRAMENLVASNLLADVLDLTTTEIADEIVGGVMPSGPNRMDVILERRIPYILSVGAVDMVNFGAMETVPEKFRNRKLHVHNSQVTLMRTTPEENLAIARWITNKLNRATSPVTVLLPLNGVSALDCEGKPFFDPEADRALFNEIKSTLRQDSLRKLIEVPLHINEPEFAELTVEQFLRLQAG